MPARAALAPGAGPVVGFIFGLAAFPESKVGHGLAIILVGVVDFASGVFGLSLQFALLEAGEASVVFEGINAKID